MESTDKIIERELVNQFRLGNEMAFELIFHRTKGRLKGFLLKVLPVDEDIESTMQEIYLKLWANRKSVKVENKFETYLYAITRNMVVDLMRKRFQKQKYLEELLCNIKERDENSMDTSVVVGYSELEKRIYDAIERLPEKRKIIFKLSKIDGLSYKEISSKLNISENTVDSQLRKALAFMRNDMKNYLSLMLWIYLNN
ncbi:sigma-70 family RNA polymerase sigma factor [uncultured Draconibacterium sp.]|uniref:sigma-70 family RNA polymerase sigma factor n=1 Tax=uncultured Draconibacterium sp. TaxID=1573823 RepID=UPI003216AF3C